MTYNPNIPQVNDDPVNSQSQILANFGVLNTDFSVNHIPLTAGGNKGRHTKVFFDAPIADPDLAPNLASLYTKTFTDPLTAANSTELFFQNLANSTGVKQLTNVAITKTTPGGATLYGFTTPWGLIINAGTVPAGIGASITFPVPYPTGFNLMTALITNQGAPGLAAAVTAVTTTQLTYNSTNACYFLVIGK